MLEYPMMYKRGETIALIVIGILGCLVVLLAGSC